MRNTNRTGDVLADAADDLEDDWPWYAVAMRCMVDGLRELAATNEVARLVLERAKRAAEGSL